MDRQNYWKLLSQIRDEVNKEIEKKRGAGEIGSALETEIELYCVKHEELDRLLRALGSELRFLLITSDACVLPLEQAPADSVEIIVTIPGVSEVAHQEKLVIRVVPVGKTKTKCVRCWHRRSDVGQNVTHPELCGRCIENIDGVGEQRTFV